MEQRVELRGPAERLDDVVVQDVSTFRAEMLDAKTLWLACYLPGLDQGDSRIAFEVSCRGGKLTFRVTESPQH